jgi:hypothetical protein
MQSKRYVSSAAGVVLALVISFGATAAQAAPLPCVQQAIAWKSLGDTSIIFTAVALHASNNAASNVASYATGGLFNSSCGRAPYGLGRVSCLVTREWMNALLSDRTFWTPTQVDDRIR